MITVLGKSGVGKSKILEEAIALFSGRQVNLSSNQVQSHTQDYNYFNCTANNLSFSLVDSVGLLDSNNNQVESEKLLEFIKTQETMKLKKIVFVYSERLTGTEILWFKIVTSIFGKENVAFLRNKSDVDRNDENKGEIKTLLQDDYMHFTLPLFLPRYPQSLDDFKNEVKSIFLSLAAQPSKTIPLNIPDNLFEEKLIEGETLVNVVTNDIPISKTVQYQETEYKKEKYTLPVTEEYEYQDSIINFGLFGLGGKISKGIRTVEKPFERDVPHIVQKSKVVNGIRRLQKKITDVKRYRKRLDGLNVYYDTVRKQEETLSDLEIY